MIITKMPGRHCRVSMFKIIALILLIFLMIHIIAIKNDPTYHYNIMKRLEPLIAKANIDVSKSIEKPRRLRIEPEYEKYIEELGLLNPGEFGVEVKLPADISDEIKKKVEEGYNRHGFNSFVSNMVSVERELTDTRSDECKSKSYSNLPKCTVIIPFHNEEWTLLLRTVHGVLNRSPDELLVEVLLVDDASDRGKKINQF